MFSFIFLLFLLYTVFQCIYIFIPWTTAFPRTMKELDREKKFSIVIPAFNEATIITHTLEKNRKLDYKNYEIIIVNDGSTDNTLSQINKRFHLQRISRRPSRKLAYQKIKSVYRSKLYRNLCVVDKVNGGKADALNCGIDFARYDWVITVDADTILREDALQVLSSELEDASIVAVGGTVHISQGYTKNRPRFLAKGLINFQVLQYLTSFYLQKFTQSRFQAITVISGAFGAFNKQVLLDVNGYRPTVGEDMDITIKVHKWIAANNKEKRMVYVPEAVSFTQCPSSYKDIFKQRFRWQKAFIDCMAIYYKDFFRKLNFPTSCYLLFDAFLLGTLNTFPILLIPLGILLGSHFLSIFLFLIVISLFLGAFQNLTAVLVSRRYEHKYKIQDNIFVLLFLFVEVFSYRLLGLLFVSIGTVLYFIDKDSWYKVSRS
ncbi:glycosyltransferase family 2 protein [Virgibacillus sp. W0181]|uniref:glycosyltransferase family 2 protein n=1 Tax=Virgibacillus sp. W0181 TaxID=3391581 RepID=UPI003F46BF27